MAVPPHTRPLVGRRSRAAIAGVILTVALAVTLGNLAVQRSEAAPTTSAATADHATTTDSATTTDRATADNEATDSATADNEAADNELTAGKAIALGVIEGVTEFLPISSTGHLLVSQRLLDIGTTPETKDAADSYAIAIQFGAILAVLVLYRRRIWSMAEGAVGRDRDGRTILLSLSVAFVPAVVIALIFEAPIKDNLLRPGLIAFAWLAGGIAILLLANRWTAAAGGFSLEEMTLKQAAIIGVAQCVAMWPGTSRSMITILVALLLGMSLAAAVEFSFLLGLITLSAATAYEVVKNGQVMLDTYGWIDPLIGLIAAFVAAVVAVKWMVGYLQKHSLAIFGWYRIAIAGATVVLMVTGTI